MPESSEIEPSLSISQHLNVAMSVHLDHLVQPKKKSNIWQGVCWHIKKYILQNHLFSISVCIFPLSSCKNAHQKIIIPTKRKRDVSAFFKKKTKWLGEIWTTSISFKRFKATSHWLHFLGSQWWNPVCWRHILHGKSSKKWVLWKLEAGIFDDFRIFFNGLYWSGPCWEIPQKNQSLHLPWIFGTGIFQSIYSNK